MRTHDPDAYHQCDQCGAKISSKFLLKRHIRVVHEKKVIVVKCKHCDLKFPNIIARQRHMNVVHFPDKLAMANLSIARLAYFLSTGSGARSAGRAWAAGRSCGGTSTPTTRPSSSAPSAARGSGGRRRSYTT